MSVKITSEREVTPEFVVSEASAIWAELKRRKLNVGDFAASDAFTSEMIKEHPEFSKAYPIVLRYICQMQEYSPTVLRRWLKKIASSPWLNEKGYFEAQANYVVMLYKSKHPNARREHICNLRANIEKLLADESENFKTGVKSAEAEVNAMEKELWAKTRRELADFVSLARDTIGPLGGTIRVETELDAGELPVVPSVDIGVPTAALGLLS